MMPDTHDQESQQLQAQMPVMHPADVAEMHASGSLQQQPPQQQQQPQLQPPHHQQQQQQQQQLQEREELSDVKVQALEALNSAFCKHIYSTALSYLQQQFSYDAASQQFMDILEQDDPYERPCTIAHQEVNSCKNRYRDVVPYDHNRVTLPPLPSTSKGSTSSSSSGGGTSTAAAHQAVVQGSGSGSSSSSSGVSSSRAPGTYINASFMSDPRLPGDASQVFGYIATQGPLPSTVADLWRMVAATNTSAIVMLTGLTDGSTSLGNSRPRCAPYFPDNEQDCLRLPCNITVTCVHKNSLDENVFFRQLEVVWGARPGSQQQATQQPRRLWINHYQYLAWPDYGIPQTSSAVRVLCHALDGCRRAGCKIVVHCSAGVGRTGTFIAVDMLLQRLHSLTLQLHGTVRDEDVRAAMDIRSLVASLRKQRRGTVQTTEQYGFVWQALIDELQVLLAEQEEQEQQLQLAQQAV